MSPTVWPLGQLQKGNLGKATGHQVLWSGLEVTCSSNALEKLWFSKERVGCAGAPHGTTLSRGMHQALWCGRVTAVTYVTACHKGPL